MGVLDGLWCWSMDKDGNVLGLCRGLPAGGPPRRSPGGIGGGGNGLTPTLLVGTEGKGDSDELVDGGNEGTDGRVNPLSKSSRAGNVLVN
jgi:hypothetical protein